MSKNLPYPQNVFYYFYKISQIPRGSGNTKAISDYCAEFAEKNNFWYSQDGYNNIIIKKNATLGYEKKPAVIIQGHLDMVCEKTADSDINFEKDGLRLIYNGDYIHAENTTLGADDGIAVAYALALLDSTDIPHPPLEIVLTSDEETGMDGAINLDFSCISGRTLLNIDSENEGVFTVSCAGGICCEGKFPFKPLSVFSAGANIRIYGLLGGHSGVEIGNNRTNANIIAGKLLSALLKIPGVQLSSINGGTKHNAIPNECSITLAFDCNESVITKAVEEFAQNLKVKLSDNEPSFDISCTVSPNKKCSVTDNKTAENIAEFLCAVHDGVKTMSTDIDGLVQTSSNLGILKTEENSIYFLSSIRSSEETENKALCESISDTAKKFGASVHISGYYPAWEYKRDSHLRDVMCAVYKKQYNKEPVIEAIHAGLECGIFCGKAKDLDCVSFGPDIFDIHTVKEKLSVPSVGRVWEFIKEVLISL